MAYLRPALAIAARLHAADRRCLSACHYRHRRAGAALPGERQPDREEQCGHRPPRSSGRRSPPTAIFIRGHRQPATAMTARPRRASNLGPITRKLIDRVAGDVAALRAEGVSGPIPGRRRHHLGERPRSRYFSGQRHDAGAAGRQGAGDCRRRMSRRWSWRTSAGRMLGVFGEPHVNVLALNLALDALTP